MTTTVTWKYNVGDIVRIKDSGLYDQYDVSQNPYQIKGLSLAHTDLSTGPVPAYKMESVNGSIIATSYYESALELAPERYREELMWIYKLGKLQRYEHETPFGDIETIAAKPLEDWAWIHLTNRTWKRDPGYGPKHILDEKIWEDETGNEFKAYSPIDYGGSGLYFERNKVFWESFGRSRIIFEGEPFWGFEDK